MIRRVRTASDHAHVVRMLPLYLDTDEDPRLGTWWLAHGSDGPDAFAGARIWESATETALILTAAGVHPRARGRGLQRELIRTRLAFARAEGLEHVWTYTHRANTPSANNLIRCGFELWRPTRWNGIEPRDPTWLFWYLPGKRRAKSPNPGF